MFVNLTTFHLCCAAIQDIGQEAVALAIQGCLYKYNGSEGSVQGRSRPVAMPQVPLPSRTGMSFGYV